jgi:23S rRNA pseudouridine2605 synthase
MRLNKFIAKATGMSRRAADVAIAEKRVKINGVVAKIGQDITSQDKATLDDKVVSPDVKTVTVILNKPVGYVCSRNGQGSRTIYDLLPTEMHHLKPIGRLDKDSSGLLMLTNDGQLANELTHPRFQKIKVYEIELDRPLSAEDKASVEQGVLLEDGISKLKIEGENSSYYRVTMAEGRNRQIRRTFTALGYNVIKLHRKQFGAYKLNDLKNGQFNLLYSE